MLLDLSSPTQIVLRNPQRNRIVTEPTPSFDPADLLRRYSAAIDLRLRREAEWRAAQHGPDDVERRLRTNLQALVSERAQKQEQWQAALASQLAQLQSEFETRFREMDAIHRSVLAQIEREAEAAQDEVEQRRGDSEWVVQSVLDDCAEDSPLRELERWTQSLSKSQEDQSQELLAVTMAVEEALEQRGRTPVIDDEFTEPVGTRDQLQEQFLKLTGEARQQLKIWRGLWIPKLLGGWRALVVIAVLAAIAGGLAWQFGDPAWISAASRQETGWIGSTAISGLVFSLLTALILYSLSGMKQATLLQQATQLVAEAGHVHQYWVRKAQEHLSQKRQATEEHQRRVVRDREAALRRYEQAHLQRKSEIEAKRAERLKEEHARFAGEHGSLQQEREAGTQTIQAEHRAGHKDFETSAAQSIQQAEQALQQWTSQSQRQRQELWSQLKNHWEQADREFQSGIAAAQGDDAAQFAEWSTLAEKNWTPPKEIPAAIRLGTHEVSLENWQGAISEDMRLAPRVSSAELPAALAFPQQASVLFLSPNATARAQAQANMQALLLRLLTLIPPGKLRLTIIDPVGLGESFSGFMHLVDYDEMLVTSRIWTETGQIESRLADLTEHMENVLQKYLRNEFATIEEYNQQAGEVAEPYHFLVIGDFPAKFSEIAARRLVSIVNSGPRCGVYTLLNLDPSKQLPNGFALADIEPAMTRLEWKKGHFHPLQAPLSNWPLRLETPPPPEQFTAIVKRVGDASRDARKVQVSFDRITPPQSEVWSRDSRSELVIPLGRAGATRLQELRLGKGTSQHMLVAGKTGSGKSTFLHILITNLALFYGPDEVNFFLIDFKKGVEFKEYASLRLPHARVIAVESDREFGVSALQKLDEILQQRGELFRKQGVQDIAGYRNATRLPLPRILLVVDEFQEFFVEDDKHSQTAALMLDRLVRQGRAFGIHVVLGSQTLGGAYSLARTTLGQVAVRVALQCSEADAHLILSEENTAARLLARPGEAIYNDANGLVEGNHPFQIAWISDQQRAQALQQLHQRALRRGITVETPVVFEGNIPSDLTINADLERIIDQHAGREQAIARPTLWLGDAVEIGPPASLTLQRQSGQNLLMVGQDPDAALGVLVSSVVAFAASGAEASTQPAITLLHGSNPDTAEHQVWKQLASDFAGMVRPVGTQGVAKMLQELVEEIARREALPEQIFPPQLLVVYHVARFRDLRKAEDDFGMGSFGGEPKPPAPGQLFAEILARGSAVGLHVLAWCDSFNNVDRWFSRQSQKELELRVAFQMNASDSTNFIDSPQASRLGTHRALLYREETGVAEKFRPYGVPNADWLAAVPGRLSREEQAEVATNLDDFNIL